MQLVFLTTSSVLVVLPTKHSTPLLQSGTTTQNVVSGSVTGDLGEYGIKFPTADSGLQIALGAEYRRDSLESVTDVTFATGDGAGQGGPTIGLSGAIDTYDVFGEFQLPIMNGRPGAELLQIGGAYRFSDYSTGISSDTWKIDVDYAPTSDIRFRAGYQRAVRAPNVIDLFSAQGFGLFDGFDPCSDDGNGGDPLATQARCEAFGVPTSSYGNQAVLTSPADQYNTLSGGNPNLDPEEAETYTIGFVLTPSFLPTLNVSVDYFDITVENLITNLDQNSILDQCYVQGNDALCDNVVRNPLGQLWTGTGNVIALNTNIGGLETAGVDLNAAYSYDAGNLGTFSTTLNGTYVDKLITDEGLAGTAPYDCVGEYASSCGTPNPKWRHRARVSWMTPLEGLDVSATWRYYGKSDIYVPGGDDSGVSDRIDYELDAFNYLDLAGSYQATDWASFRFGVNNVLDKAPPIVSGGGASTNGNTYTTLYDALGRYIFAGVTLDF